MMNALRRIKILAHGRYAAVPQFCRKFAPRAAMLRTKMKQPARGRLFLI